MKTIFLCGGKGVRLVEETEKMPKPMVPIGNMPILMHLIKIYSHYNCKDFILCLGYKQEIIKDYFLNFHINNSDVMVNLRDHHVNFLKKCEEDLNIYLVNTGEETFTGGRLLQIKNYITEDYFFVNYSDGLADINLYDLIKFHKSHGKIATLTAVQKVGKFGTIQLNDNEVTSFLEKPIDEDYINGGFFIFSKRFFDYLRDDDLPNTLQFLSKENQLMAYKHKGQWDCMDTLNDKIRLESLWQNNQAFWKIW